MVKLGVYQNPTRQEAKDVKIRIMLEVDTPEQAALLRQHHAFLEEMAELAAKAPSGYVLDVCEMAVMKKGQEHNREVLEKTVQKHIEALEKKTVR